MICSEEEEGKRKIKSEKINALIIKSS